MTEPDHESNAIRVWFRLLRLQARLHVAASDRLKKLGVSVAQCDVLTTLTEREGVSQQDLAERLYVTKGNISGLIDRLANAGLVERRKLKGDRRTHSIYLTPEGRRLAVTGLAIQRAFVTETLGRLSPEQLAQMDALFQQTSEILKKEESSSEGNVSE